MYPFTATDAPAPPPTAEPAAGAARDTGADTRAAELETALLDRYAEVSGIPRDELDAHTPFVENRLYLPPGGRTQPAARGTDLGVGTRTLFFEHGDMAHVAEDAVRRCGATPRRAPDAGRPRTTAGPAAPYQSRRNESRRGARPGREPGPAEEADGAIAVIGVAGRFPQAGDLEAFWANLESGTTASPVCPPTGTAPAGPSTR
ncbi:hypothetical protein SVIOM342S_05263 [Streptomyces violaceorubidus]